MRDERGIVRWSAEKVSVRELGRRPLMVPFVREETGRGNEEPGRW
jgi:hypothetical protein